MKIKVEQLGLRMFSAVLGIAASMLIVSGCGDKYEKALTLFEQEKWQEALAEAEKTPKEDARLQFYIGDCHAKGLGGLTNNITEAVSWYRKAAEQNDPDALIALGWCYDAGRGVDKDPVKGAQYFQKSAATGSVKAKSILGMWSYYRGIGVEKDEKKAVQLLRESVTNGLYYAKQTYAFILRDGECGVKKDLKEALYWFEKAAEGGQDVARNEVAFAYALADRCCYKFVDRDFDKALKYLKLAADNGHGKSEWDYGRWLSTGKIFDVPVQDAEVTKEKAQEGYKYIMKAAAHGHKKAINAAGNIHWFRNYDATNRVDHETMALKCWKMAASNGDADSKKIAEAFERKNLTPPFQHKELKPIEEVDTFCGISLTGCGIGKVKEYSYKFKDGNEYYWWLELEKPFRNFKKANLYYTPVSKTLRKVELCYESLDDDKFSRFAEFVALREILTKKYGVHPKMIMPKEMPVALDKFVVPMYRWEVGNIALELSVEEDVVESFHDILLCAIVLRADAANAVENVISGKMFKHSDDGGDAL